MFKKPEVLLYIEKAYELSKVRDNVFAENLSFTYDFNLESFRVKFVRVMSSLSIVQLFLGFQLWHLVGRREEAGSLVQQDTFIMT